MFDKFVLPYFQKITGQAKNSGYKVVLHSCGSIERVIPKLIDAGVDALHPIQARARNMGAETLARKYGEKVIFIGGIDAQGILPFGTPEQIRDEVNRLKNLFGSNFIVSPSHEELLPNIPPENILAMAEAAVS
jgi:uroporphyrinogen decarboxylase